MVYILLKDVASSVDLCLPQQRKRVQQMHSGVFSASALMMLIIYIILPRPSASAPILSQEYPQHLCDSRGYCNNNNCSSSDKLEADAIVAIFFPHSHA
jgi:hypothetical protein